MVLLCEEQQAGASQLHIGKGFKGYHFEGETFKRPTMGYFAEGYGV
jgi:hypothetical protein